MGSATSAVLDALAEEGAETEQALRAARWVWGRMSARCAVENYRESGWYAPHIEQHCFRCPAASRHRCCRQEQAAAADELESAADERRGCEQQLLQHARASSREERRRSEALAGQLQQVQARAAQLVQQCQVEREVCSTAQQLVEELQAAHNAAVGEAQEERQQREALLAHLQSIQVRMCGMATPAAPQR